MALQLLGCDSLLQTTPDQHTDVTLLGASHLDPFAAVRCKHLLSAWLQLLAESHQGTNVCRGRQQRSSYCCCCHCDELRGRRDRIISLNDCYLLSTMLLRRSRQKARASARLPGWLQTRYGELHNVRFDGKQSYWHLYTLPCACRVTVANPP